MVGDQRYAPREPVLGLSRLFLHAAELGFQHPVHGGAMRFVSTLPSELVDLARSQGFSDELSAIDPGE